MSKIIQIHQPNIFTEAKVCQQMPGFIMLNTTIQHFVDFIEKLPIDAIKNTDPVLATIITNSPNDLVKLNIFEHFIQNT
jgi:hypothetical protein